MGAIKTTNKVREMIEIKAKIIKWQPPAMMNVRGKPEVRGELITDYGLNARVFVHLSDADSPMTREQWERSKEYDELRRAEGMTFIFIGEWIDKDIAFLVPLEGGWRLVE